jgi:hypothetical protein
VGPGGSAARGGSSEEEKQDREFLTHEDQENWYDEAEASDSVWE